MSQQDETADHHRRLLQAGGETSVKSANGEGAGRSGPLGRQAGRKNSLKAAERSLHCLEAEVACQLRRTRGVPHSPGARSRESGHRSGQRQHRPHPLVVITGQASTRRMHQQSHQNMDSVRMFQPIIKGTSTARGKVNIPKWCARSYAWRGAISQPPLWSSFPRRSPRPRPRSTHRGRNARAAYRGGVGPVGY